MHYVEAPNWKELVRRGTVSLDVALTEPAFFRQTPPETQKPKQDRFQFALHRMLDPRVIQTRSQARQAVTLAAEVARDQLGLPPASVVLEYVCGAVGSLDPYSGYLTPEQYCDVQSQIKGSFVGLGIELKADNGALKIVRVISGSPAHHGGVHTGDRIVAVDGRSTKSLSTDEAADLLQGEADSAVELSLLAPGQPLRRISIRRRYVEVPSIEGARIIDRRYGVAYFKLTCFQKTTSRDVEAALWQLHREGMNSLIIDLCGNPGGLLISAVEVVDKFVDCGIIVSTRGLHEDFTYSAHAGGTWQVPLVVLIDQDSASAAEIFAGAIRDHRRGTIVGRRSYGKGSVQGLFPLNSTEAGLRLTTAKFYSPTGRPYNGIGVEPDVLVHQVAKPVENAQSRPAAAGDDPMLAAAVQAARQLHARQADHSALRSRSTLSIGQ